MLVDRRRAERERRRLLRTKATFAIKTVAGRDVGLAQCEDLALSGMTLRRVGGTPWSIGLSVKLMFSLPGERTVLTAHAVVVTDRAAASFSPFRRTGIAFLRLPGETERRLRTFLTRSEEGAHVEQAAGF